MFESVKNEKLHEDVGQQIGRRIIRGDLEPGMLLPAEAVLVEQFDVSRAVLREALRSLMQRGLVDMRQGKRTQVLEERRWNVLDPLVLTLYREEGRIKSLLEDFMWIRRILEPEIAAKTAGHVNPGLVVDLDASLQRMETLLDDRAAFFEEDMAFHNALAEATGNRVLGRLMHTVAYLFNVGRDPDLETNASPGESLDWHRRICSEIKQGRVDQARQAMAEHIDWKARRISAADRTLNDFVTRAG